MRVKRTIVFFLVAGFLFFYGTVYAGSDYSGNAGGEFLRYGISARSLGMGKSAVSFLGADDGAIYYNPGGIINCDYRININFSHFPLFGESYLDFININYSHPGRIDKGMGGFFFGPKSSWSVAFAMLGSGAYEFRDDSDRLIDDDFGIYDWATLVGFSREAITSSGIYNYGFVFKVLGKGFSGLDNPLFRYSSDHDVGLDFGAQIQFINPPLLRSIVPLDKLLPLRLGISVQNLINPSLGYSSVKDNYPTMLRCGLSYDLMRKSRGFNLKLAADFDWMYSDFKSLILNDRSDYDRCGSYYGAEAEYRFDKTNLLGRMGLYNDLGRYVWTFGIGVDSRIFDRRVRVEFARVSHDELHDGELFGFFDDYRFTISTYYGEEITPGKYKSLYRSAKEANLKILSAFPNKYDRAAARDLAKKYDIANARRYYRFIGGAKWVSYLYEDMQDLLVKDEKKYLKRCLASAEDIVKKYDEVFEKSRSEFDQVDLLNYAETLVLLNKPDSAISVLNNVKLDCARKYFLLGLSYYEKNKLDSAISSFTRGMDFGDDSNNTIVLIKYALASCYMIKKEYVNALDILKDMTTSDSKISERYSRVLFRIGKDYEFYPPFKDRLVADDAMYLTAVCLKRMNRVDEAIRYLASIKRFYGDSDRVVEAEKLLEDMLNK